ncbi:putative glucosylceramidase 4 [Macrosteles quadrilineatus]|uniref:putative glucosylceramidase 4 n=1 Tax=Macrosteles quadrilineatus TaxID=74068 RepID=UPI0023E20D20|nr:putative glucosylceramidase 4 [Macrosteles quadrilineatus]
MCMWSLVLLTLLAFHGQLSSSENIPCNVRDAEAGYICVCNATYCDTIEQPKALPRGSYYHYSTSSTSPGFTMDKGRFMDSARNSTLGSSKDVFVRINSGVQYQTFEGFGASMTAGAGIMITSLPLAAQQNLIESYFGVTGLEYSMIRVPIAASDFSPDNYTYDDVPGDVALEHFSLTADDYQLKIPLLKMAINASKRGIKLIGSSWSAPYWMKTNNNCRLGLIYNKYLGVWANYHLKFLQAYKQNGVDFWAITLGNEVSLGMLFGPWFPIQNTLLPPLVARYWTKKYLGPLLKSSNFSNVKILALDDQRPFMGWYMDRMFADPEVAQYIEGVAIHFYLDSNSNLKNLKEFHDKYPDKMVLYTESSISAFNGGGHAVELGDWDRARMYIESILTNLNNWAVCYIDYNMALNDQGGPTGFANLTLDAAVIVNKTSGEFYKQPLFYVMGHFSKFIPPGSKSINVTINQPFKAGDYFDYEFDGQRIMRRQVNAGDNVLIDVVRSSPPPSPTPFPTRKPIPPATSVMALASSNPDGSYSVVVYNPRSEPVNIIIIDPKIGFANQTVAGKSLNTFVYW